MAKSTLDTATIFGILVALVETGTDKVDEPKE